MEWSPGPGGERPRVGAAKDHPGCRTQLLCHKVLEIQKRSTRFEINVSPTSHQALTKLSPSFHLVFIQFSLLLTFQAKKRGTAPDPLGLGGC